MIPEQPVSHDCPPDVVVIKFDGGRRAILCDECRLIIGYLPPGWGPRPVPPR